MDVDQLTSQGDPLPLDKPKTKNARKRPKKSNTSSALVPTTPTSVTVATTHAPTVPPVQAGVPALTSTANPESAVLPVVANAIDTTSTAEDDPDEDSFVGGVSFAVEGVVTTKVPFVLPEDNKPWPEVLVDDHLKPFAGLKEGDVKELLNAFPYAVLGVCSGRHVNEAKVDLVRRAAQAILKIEGHEKPPCRAVKKEDSAFVLVALESQDQLNELVGVGRALAVNESTFVFFRRVRRAPFRTRFIQVAQVQPAERDDVHKAIHDYYFNRYGNVTVTPRPDPESLLLVFAISFPADVAAPRNFTIPSSLNHQGTAGVKPKYVSGLPYCVNCHGIGHKVERCRYITTLSKLVPSQGGYMKRINVAYGDEKKEVAAK